MVLTDPISDMLTRIRNGQRARRQMVEVPASKMKLKIAEILQREGYVSSAELVPDKPFGRIRIGIKYLGPKQPLISELKRVSKPGRRIFASVAELAEKQDTISTTILSTSRGIMTDREAIEAKIGGEVILRVH